MDDGYIHRNVDGCVDAWVDGRQKERVNGRMNE